MKRRDFITLLGGAAALGSAAATWLFSARPQQPAIPMIGYLSSIAGDELHLAAFRQGLRETSYIEGQNVLIEYRAADDEYDQLPALAADLVGRRVTAIAATGGVATPLAAKAATSTIPIIFQIATDPVEAGLVASLNRPGGNVTGVTTLGADLTAKRLELLRELVPDATVVAALVNPASPAAETIVTGVQAAARTLGLKLHVLHASTELDFDTGFATLVKLRIGALLITPDAVFRRRIEQLGALCIRHAIPAIYSFREFVAAGGLMSYGGSSTDVYRLVGVYTGRILNGEKPVDLPVQQVTKVELILNLKTAKTLGLTVPATLLGRADEVIE
jgi:putative ABC transport system substrate-binding protein